MSSQAPNPSNVKVIPGLSRTSDHGNRAEMSAAGSLHEFLLKLHADHGPIAAFWWDTTYTVSICTHELFQQHQHVFDRPKEPFLMFEPMFELSSVTFANGEEGHARRRQYDAAFTQAAVDKYFPTFQEAAESVLAGWGSTERFPACEQMGIFSLRSTLLPLFGRDLEDAKIIEFEETTYKIWSETELRLTVPPTEERIKMSKELMANLHSVTDSIVKNRKSHLAAKGKELLIDRIIEYTQDSAVVLSDAIEYCIGGLQTTRYLLAWCLYHLARNPEVQERAYTEIHERLGDAGVDHENIKTLTYLRQVLDETLRCALIVPWAARFREVDTQLGGYTVPKHTPVIQALGVASKNSTVFPHPDRFDPDRFSPENVKGRPSLSFVPFGFAGGRKCPAEKYEYGAATVMLAAVLKRFRVELVEEKEATPVYGLVTKPKEEIWLKAVVRA